MWSKHIGRFGWHRQDSPTEEIECSLGSLPNEGRATAATKGPSWGCHSRHHPLTNHHRATQAR
uniref:Uncharacterized protein n=1 Tax=Rhodococcus sp. Mel TaxID=1093626 RepID=H8ZKS6_9NOCA|nr:hypothetical protein [Rhodococcus sp. Mel]